MSAERNRTMREGFLIGVLPWLVAVGGFLVYLATLNPWISLGSVESVARTSGWIWQPQLQQPVTFLASYPFRLLPKAWIPLTLNLFAAAAGALTLGLLARSVALLPHDRTRDERWREASRYSTLSMPTAWMPPLLAVLACGLQLTFWEDATSATGAMFNLLMFAGVIGCLLEFRVSPNQVWLSGSAFLYAAGMTNDWAMIGCFPLYLAAVLWLKRRAFFEPRFLLTMTLWGLAGLSLYLVLPAIHTLEAAAHLDFWPVLKANLKSQRDALSAFPRVELLVSALTCLLPLLFISIRWRSEAPHSGDDNPATLFLTRAMFILAHATFVAVSLWMALDSPVSPRNLADGARLLIPYYLSALVVGYSSGYLLLVGSVPIPGLARFSRWPHRQKLIARLTVAGFGFLLVAVPLALVWRNLGEIRTTNGPAVREFARQLYQSLPAGRSVVLGEDPVQLFLLQGELVARRHQKDALVMDVESLFLSRYHIIKAGQFKSRWPVALPADGLEVVEPVKVLALLSRFASREQVVYLHPSFNFCFEVCTAQPHGAILYLVPQPGTARSEPLDARLVAASEQYWQNLWSRNLHTLAAPAAERPVNMGWATRLRLVPEENRTVAYLAVVYSRALNCWGVHLQRAGRWKEAGLWFERALALQPENLAARINWQFNGRYQRGATQRLDLEAAQEEFLHLFTRHRRWERVMDEDGPVDEPTFLFETARVLLAGGRPRQAIREYSRCAGLAPDWLEARLWLAQAHLTAGEFASALRITGDLEVNGLPQDESSLAQFLFCRTMALRSLGKTNEAAACIQNILARHPDKPEVLSTAAQLYLESGQYQPTLTVLERLLAREPGDPELLSNKGLAEMGLARYDAALATLSMALARAPTNQVVRLNRAIANLRAGNLEAAQADYQVLLPGAADSYKVLFGLAEIAWRRRDTNTAIQFYQRCLDHSLPASADHKLVADRLKQLGPTAN